MIGPSTPGELGSRRSTAVWFRRRPPLASRSSDVRRCPPSSCACLPPLAHSFVQRRALAMRARSIIGMQRSDVAHLCAFRRRTPRTAVRARSGSCMAHPRSEPKQSNAAIHSPNFTKPHRGCSSSRNAQFADEEKFTQHQFAAIGRAAEAPARNRQVIHLLSKATSVRMCIASIAEKFCDASDRVALSDSRVPVRTVDTGNAASGGSHALHL